MNYLCFSLTQNKFICIVGCFGHLKFREAKDSIVSELCSEFVFFLCKKSKQESHKLREQSKQIFVAISFIFSLIFY